MKTPAGNPTMKTIRNPILVSVAAALLAAFAAHAADTADLAARASRYESGGDVTPLREIDAMLQASIGDAARRAELESLLIRLLAADATFEARRAACERLSVCGTEAALPALAPLLADEQTTGIACLALGGIPSPKATSMLLDALPAARGNARLQIVGALGGRGDAAAVKALAALAGDADVPLACAAIRALGRIPAAPAREALAALRANSRPETAVAVASATLEEADRMAAAGDRAASASLCAGLMQASQPAFIRRGAFSSLLRLDADEGMGRIRTTLTATPPDVQLLPIAIARIAVLKAPDASKTHAAMLPGLPPAAQVWMLDALEARGDADARAAIVAQAAATEATVRRHALAAIGRLEDTTAVPLLAKALADARAQEDVEAAEQALTVLRGGEATDRAIAAAMQSAQGAARTKLIGLLARRDARSALPALLAESGGADAAAAKAAFQALAKIAVADDLPALLERLVSLQGGAARAEAETAAARALAKIAQGPDRSKAVLALLGRNPPLEARCSLLRMLPVAGDAAGLDALQKALTDAEAPVRETAVRGLAGWPGAAAWDAAAGLYLQPGNDAARVLALRGLVRMAGELNAKPDAALIERYRKLLGGARTDDDRKLILSALAGVAHPDALALALPLLDAPGVKAEAILALQRIIPAVRPSHPKEAAEAAVRLKAAGGQP